MNDKWLDEIKLNINRFFSDATESDIRSALKDAGYECYTGISIESLNIKKPTHLAWQQNILMPFYVDSKITKSFQTIKTIDSICSCGDLGFCDDYYISKAA